MGLHASSDFNQNGDISADLSRFPKRKIPRKFVSWLVGALRVKVRRNTRQQPYSTYFSNINNTFKNSCSTLFNSNNQQQLASSTDTELLKTISALFWDITQRVVVILYRRFVTPYRSHLQGSLSPRRSFLLEDGANRLFRNVGMELAPLAG
jgi:hypothetical protein